MYQSLCQVGQQQTTLDPCSPDLPNRDTASEISCRSSVRSCVSEALGCPPLEEACADTTGRKPQKQHTHWKLCTPAAYKSKLSGVANSEFTCGIVESISHRLGNSFTGVGTAFFRSMGHNRSVLWNTQFFLFSQGCIFVTLVQVPGRSEQKYRDRGHPGSLASQRVYDFDEPAISSHDVYTMLVAGD